ncbi:MAG: transposase [Alphaproteobacteria bacterium]|nr:transposase [Alphaproteobacteria bacterium]
MTDVVLLNDAERPRRWSREKRHAVLAAAFAAGAVFSAVARQFKVSTGQIYLCGVSSSSGLTLRE